MSKPKIIYSEQTGGDYIEVIEDGEFRWFTTGDDIPQGRMSLNTPHQPASPYVEAMMLALVLSDAVHRVLLLGLGGGSVARFLRHYFPDFSISAIEASAPLIDLNKRYFFLPKEDEHFRLYCADAEEMLRLKRKPKEIIFVDLPQTAAMQSLLGREDFLKHCYGRFQGQGIWVAHVHARQNLFPTLTSVFTGGVWRIPLEDSDQIIFAFKETPPDLHSLKKKAERLEKETGVNFSKWLKKISVT